MGSHVLRKIGIVALLVLVSVAQRAAGPTIAIDLGTSAGKVSQLFAGLMTEEINHGYDGGLYAELVQNRAFLDDPAVPARWSLVQDAGAAAMAPWTYRSSDGLGLHEFLLWAEHMNAEPLLGVYAGYSLKAST